MLSTQVTFGEVEELRRALGASIEEVAALVGATPLSYKRWRGGTVPRIEKEPGLNWAFDVLAYCQEHDLLPVSAATTGEAKLKRAQALEYAEEVLRDV